MRSVALYSRAKVDTVLTADSITVASKDDHNNVARGVVSGSFSDGLSSLHYSCRLRGGVDLCTVLT